MIKVGFIDDENTNYADYAKRLSRREIELIQYTQEISSQNIVDWIISENILCLIVDYDLQKKFKGNGTNIIFDINQILPDFPCIMLTNYPEPSKNEKIVSRRLIWDRDRMNALDLSSVVDEIKNEIDVFLQRKQILFSQYEELLEKRQHATMSAMEEERFLQLHSLFSKYGETDDIPTQLLTADADKKLDSIIEKLSKLVDRKED